MNNFNYFTCFLFLFGGLCPLTHCVDIDHHVHKFSQTEFFTSAWWFPSPNVVLVGARLKEDDVPDEMCAAAKELVSIPAKNFDNERSFIDTKVRPTGIKFVGREDLSSPFEVIWCDVTPLIYVRRVGTSGNELSLMMKFAPFKDKKDYYWFNVEYIESDPTPCLEGDVGNKIMAKWNICEAASEHVPEQKPAVMQTSETILQLLEFEYIGGGREKHIAVDCLSHPPMFVYYGDGDRNLKVMVKRSI